MLKILYIALGGALGSMFRFYVNSLFPFNGVSFPKSTFIVNILASFILGFFSALIYVKYPNASWIKYVVLIGFCGAFSTFSTFALELYQLSQNHFWISIIYVISSILCSVFCIAIGFYIVKFL